MMYGHEKSDSVIVAVKPTLAEPRTETKGNVGWPTNSRSEISLPSTRQPIGLRRVMFSK
jgi:hypothetical protein